MILKNKVAIITGAGSGIGKASAKLFAKEGANVVVADINEKTGLEVVKDITALGGQATFIKVDVSSSSDNQRMIQKAMDAYGRLDILFNNAGILGEPLERLTEERWRREIDVMLTGPFLACNCAIPIMRKQKSGNILNTSSIAAFDAGGRGPGYASAKSGLVMLTKYLAKILAPDNIRINCICPGGVKTGLTGFTSQEEKPNRQQTFKYPNIPMGRLAEPEEIASVALFLASDQSSFVTGVALVTDGGTIL
jgi:NAD(P)-dependent dehydrogenase (short-subunit alcohol dehydrogenase family)